MAWEPVGERDCERCLGPLDVASERRVSMATPVVDLGCRYPACGYRMRVRQEVMTVALLDITGKTLFKTDLAPELSASP